MPAANAPVVPIIDLDLADAPPSAIAHQLVAAARDHGFIYVRNRGVQIPARAIDEAFTLSARLFDAPLAEKQRCLIRHNRGWSPMHTETLDPKHQRTGDIKEAFNFGEFVDGKAQQPLPTVMAADEPRLSAFADACRKLCHKILYLLGLGLDVGDFFSSAHFTSQDGSGTVLRFLRYPPDDATAHADGDVRAGVHSDYGSMTLLFRLRGQAGLEILKRDNTWAPVPVCPAGTEDDPSPPILVNIGDLLSYWTNGLLRSTVHRVVFPTDVSSVVAGESSSAPRYSIAFFCHPMDQTRLEPVPGEQVRNYVPAGDTPDANPYAQRRVMTAAEHLSMRLKETYGSLHDDKDVQPPA